MNAIKAHFKGGSVCRVSSWSWPNAASDGGGKKGQADLRLPVPGAGVQYDSSQLHPSRPLFNLPLGSTPIYYHENQRKKTWIERLWTPHSVEFSRSAVSDSANPWTTACQASLSITNFRSLLKLTSIELVMPSSHLILCCPLLLLPSVFPSIRVFSMNALQLLH